MNIKVTVNDAQLQRRLAQIRMSESRAATKAAEAAAEVVRDGLRETAPKATGEGAQDIEYDAKAGHADIGQQDKWYLRYHEKGTSIMAAHPFVAETAESTAEEAANKAGLAYLKGVGM